jgi:DNA mismatch endonuclease (patch repair protein)
MIRNILPGGLPMVDRLTPERRSWLMGRVGPKDTKPEMAVRRIAHNLGYRFRLHRRDLPGSPDLVFPRLRKILFVHGCFWHRHGCKKTSTPKSNAEFWLAKFERNIERDRNTIKALEGAGWSVKTVWECETKDIETLTREIEDFLSDA